MKKYFVFSDVHGFYDELMEALKKQKFDIYNPNHHIISLGDACDRGKQPKEVLTFLMDMYDSGRATLIYGNHEQLMVEAILRGYFKSHDFHNRTNETAALLTGHSYNEEEAALQDMENNELWNDYIKATVNYAEIGDNIFVHGWIPTRLKIVEEEQFKDIPDYYKPTQPAYNPDWKKFSWGVEWEEALWMNGIKAWKMGIVEPGKTIWCGHWMTNYGNALYHDAYSFDLIQDMYEFGTINKSEYNKLIKKACAPFEEEGIKALDATTVYTHIVNCLTFTQK